MKMVAKTQRRIHEENDMANVDATRNEVAEHVEGGGGEAPDDLSRIQILEGELEAARAEAEEYLDGWRRAKAEFANYKKRRQAEQTRMREQANASLIRKLLPVLDDFDRAVATMPAGFHKLSWIEGILMVRRKLEVVLESEGVEPIETRGETFDPRYHEAVTHEELEGYDEGEIIGEIQKGYLVGEWVLRPALVRVAKAPPVPSDGEDDTGTEGNTLIDE